MDNLVFILRCRDLGFAARRIQWPNRVAIKILGCFHVAGGAACALKPVERRVEAVII